MDTYRTGTTCPQIKFAADIDTFGFARTRATVVDTGSHKAISSLVSKDATGDIPRDTLGSATDLAGKMLIITTEISFTNFSDAEERKNEYDRVNVNYFLEMGDEGHKIFPTEDQRVDLDDSFKVVVFIKKIKLLA